MFVSSPLNSEVRRTGLGKLKKQLTGIWLGLVVAHCLLAACFLIYSRNNYIKLAETTSMNLCNLIKGHLQSDLDRSDILLRTTAAEYILLKEHFRMPLEAVRTILGQHNVVFDVDTDYMRVADADGNVIAGGNSDTLKNLAHMDFFQEAKNGTSDTQLIISKPLKGSDSGKWTLYLARRMNNPDKTFAGIVYIAYLLEKFEEGFSTVNTGPGGVIVLRDINMGLINRYPHVHGSEADIGKPGKTPPQLRALLEAGAKTGTVKLHAPFDNRWRISSFAHITPYPFILITGHGMGEILKHWYFETYWCIGIVLLASALLWAVKQRVLKDAVKQVASIDELRRKDKIILSQSRNAAMGEMIGNIAHQWRQPLNALAILMINLKLTCQDRGLTDKFFTDTTTKADQLIQKMSDTIDDFRNFFRPDKNKEHFSALNQIKRAVELVETAYKNSEIIISIEGITDCNLYGFPNEYSQVLLNLLGNAKDAIVEAGMTDGRIIITYGRDSDMGVVTVRNNGGEIPADIIDRIFDPYFTSKSSGTGIGLHMSKTIIENNMHGRIEVHNIEGGCEFTVYVPLGG